VSEFVEVCPARMLAEGDWIGAAEACRLCRIELEVVMELADLGLVSPRGDVPLDWQVPAGALPRLALAGRLIQDLGVNVSGAVLAIELLERQRSLQRQIELLQRLAGD